MAAFSALAAPCTVQIVRRTGGGLLLARLLRRPGILCGFVLFLALLRVFSGYLWCIDFGTLSPGSAAALRAVLAEQQVTEGCRLSKPRLQAAQNAVLQQSDVFGWVSLNFVNGCLFAEATPTQTQTVQPETSALPPLRAPTAAGGRCTSRYRGRWWHGCKRAAPRSVRCKGSLRALRGGRRSA